MADVTLRTIAPDERDAVLDLLAGWLNDRAFFARYFAFDPTFRGSTSTRRWPTPSARAASGSKSAARAST